MEPLARLTPATIDVLRVFLGSKKPVWGLQIVKSTERPSGSIYPILDRLENAGWVVGLWEENEERVGARRRYYALSEGARVASAEAIAEFERRQAGKLSRRPQAGLADA